MERRMLSKSADIVIGDPNMIAGMDVAEGSDSEVTMIVDADSKFALVSVDKDGGYCFACSETKFFPGDGVIKHYFQEHCK